MLMDGCVNGMSRSNATEMQFHRGYIILEHIWRLQQVKQVKETPLVYKYNLHCRPFATLKMMVLGTLRRWKIRKTILRSAIA